MLPAPSSRPELICRMTGTPIFRCSMRTAAPAVSQFLRTRADIKAISELLGHSSVAFTLQVYGHLLEETKRETADKMDSALSPVATTVATKTDILKVN